MGKNKNSLERAVDNFENMLSRAASLEKSGSLINPDLIVKENEKPKINSESIEKGKKGANRLLDKDWSRFENGDLVERNRDRARDFNEAEGELEKYVDLRVKSLVRNLGTISDENLGRMLKSFEKIQKLGEKNNKDHHHFQMSESLVWKVSAAVEAVKDVQGIRAHGESNKKWHLAEHSVTKEFNASKGDLNFKRSMLKMEKSEHKFIKESLKEFEDLHSLRYKLSFGILKTDRDRELDLDRDWRPKGFDEPKNRNLRHAFKAGVDSCQDFLKHRVNKVHPESLKYIEKNVREAEKRVKDLEKAVDKLENSKDFKKFSKGIDETCREKGEAVGKSLGENLKVSKAGMALEQAQRKIFSRLIRGLASGKEEDVRELIADAAEKMEKLKSRKEFKDVRGMDERISQTVEALKDARSLKDVMALRAEFEKVKVDIVPVKKNGFYSERDVGKEAVGPDMREVVYEQLLPDRDLSGPAKQAPVAGGAFKDVEDFVERSEFSRRAMEEEIYDSVPPLKGDVRSSEYGFLPSLDAAINARDSIYQELPLAPEGAVLYDDAFPTTQVDSAAPRPQVEIQYGGVPAALGTPVLPSAPEPFVGNGVQGSVNFPPPPPPIAPEAIADEITATLMKTGQDTVVGGNGNNLKDTPVNGNRGVLEETYEQWKARLDNEFGARLIAEQRAVSRSSNQNRGEQQVQVQANSENNLENGLDKPKGTSHIENGVAVKSLAEQLAEAKQKLKSNAQHAGSEQGAGTDGKAPTAVPGRRLSQDLGKSQGSSRGG